jgi:hypothetical protein
MLAMAFLKRILLCILQDLFVKKDNNSLEVDRQRWKLQAVDLAALH